MGWLRRYRHSKGFGVHSPFAFSFITDCLNLVLPYCFYDYDLFDNPRDRLLYRVVAWMNPPAIAIVGDDDVLTQVAIAACPHAQITTIDGTKASDMIIASGALSGAEIEAICRAIGRGAVVYVRHGTIDAASRLYAALDNINHGMTFDNKRGTLIVVPRPTLPRQDIEVAY